MASFITGIFEASSAKLACSVDDVIWLSAFLTPNFRREERIKNALVYIFICLSQPLTALFISTCGEAALDTFVQTVFGDVKFSTDKFLTIVGGIILVCYAIFLGAQFARENFIPTDTNDDNHYDTILKRNSSGDNINHNDDSIVILSNDNNNNDDDDPENNIKNEEEEEEKKFETDPTNQTNDGLRDRRKLHALEIEITHSFDCSSSSDTSSSSDGNANHNDSSQSLVFIAFFGSLDGLTLYVPLLAGKVLGIIQLLIGVAISVSFIVIVAFSITKCKVVSDVLQRIPIFVIVSIFATLLLVKGLLMP